MEEKRREAGSPSPAATIPGGSSMKLTDSPATEPPPRRRGQKRKSTNSSSTTSSAPPKRHAREKAAAAAAAASGSIFSNLPPIHSGPLTRARQLSDSNAAIFSALNAIKNEASMTTVNDSAVIDREESAVNEEIKKFQALIDAEFDSIRNRDASVHVVPVAAGWFSWTNIHSIEKQTLRSFFNGKVENRTPEIYKEIRNWIMKKFHANPSTNIELKDLSELSVGDPDARQEIMEFLDHWGLINYHPLPQSDPAKDNADPNTDAEMAENTDSLLEKLYRFENEQSSLQLVPRAKMSTATVPSGLFPESIAEELVKQEGPAVEYHCNSCSADCSRKRYHCQKQADFDLCTECYNNGKFGSGMCPSDFILMEPAEASGATGGKWTDQETLLLLEALELFKENWNEIAEHVATKTKAQCILHFLQMPIEDSFLDYDDKINGVQENGEPISNIESPVPNDISEPSEGKASKDNSEAAEAVSGNDNSEPSAGKINKDKPELEMKTDVNTAQAVSVEAETLNLEEAPDGNVVHDKGDDIVIKALKEAFHIAGCPLTPEDKLSFAEAGNSVMTLAAFLSQLVEPGLATASAHNSLKTISHSSPGLQLAERHCFVLEDPPDVEKEHIASESMTTENIDQNASEMAKENLKTNKTSIRNEAKDNPLSVEKHSTEGQIDKKKASKSTNDPTSPPRELDACADNSRLPEKPVEETLQVTQKPDKESPQVTEKPAEEIPKVSEKTDIETQLKGKPDKETPQVTEKSEEKSQVTEKSDEEKSEVAEKPDAIRKVEHTEKKLVDELKSGDVQNEQLHTTKEQVSSATEVRPPDSVCEPENLKTTTDKDMVLSSVVSDKTEQRDMPAAVPMDGVVADAEDKMEVDKSEDTKSMKKIRTKEEDNVDKLKRAALATLSAAAVKAKLLANQEEDEIRQLAIVMIEKQMRKLEIKLSYFTEMESAIMRVREHLERSRQKLFSERAQIIASRLGTLPSSRMLPSSYPINKMPPGFVNSMMRPPLSMGAQRPFISRPVATSAPPTMNTSAPPEKTGPEGNPT
ncbi:unnamed protein product [Amaranthus hypochondriacus]